MNNIDENLIFTNNSISDDTLQEQWYEIELTNKLNQALAREYGTIFILNLLDGTMHVRKMNTNQNAKKLNLPKKMPFDIFIKQYAENFVLDEYKDNFLQKINIASLRKRVDNGDYKLGLRYKVKPNATGEENFEAVIIPVEMKNHYDMVVGIKCIDRLIAQEESDKALLRIAREQAEAANKAKTAFLFNMSHDIRTPMNAILGFTRLLDKYQEYPERRKDYLKKITESSSILLSIINNVLEMARVEKGTIALEEVDCNAKLFYGSLYTNFCDMMESKGLEFTFNLNVQHINFKCDTTKLREVFFNIISNAYKYTPAGGKINMQLDEIPSDKEGYALFRTTISDTGQGMSEEYIPHIFEEFSRERNTTHAKIEGTGLGMPIVKKLVELMNGTIEIESKIGAGTKVIVTLPHKYADEPIINHSNEDLSKLHEFSNKRILLAEDNDLNSEIAIEILSEIGCTIERAENGKQCVSMLTEAESNYYNLILMDVQMPEMNGYEATRLIRSLDDKTKADIPIIAMTANAFEEDKQTALRNGMNAHVSKPFDFYELTMTLAEYL